MINIDYINLGSIGFAQLSDNDYWKKSRIERNVLFNLLTSEKYQVPVEFMIIASFRWKSFNHDFGTYYEMCILYDRDHIEELEETDPLAFNRFYDWVNLCESIDYDSEELLNLCYQIYQEKYPMTLIYKKDEEDQDKNSLNAV